MQKKISIFEIKKYLNKKGFIVKKKKKIETQKSGLDNLSRTFLSSLIIISIFFIAPLATNRLYCLKMMAVLLLPPDPGPVMSGCSLASPTRSTGQGELAECRLQSGFVDGAFDFQRLVIAGLRHG